MCGIAGVFNFRDVASSSSVESLQKMAKQMNLRGPDDEGYYISSPIDESFSGDKTVRELRCSLRNINNLDGSIRLGLVHRRLSIIDTSSGSHQPMISSNQRYVISFNGEIYNYLELTEILKKKGIQLRTRGDTEVLLELYSLYQEKALDYLNGDFSFAIWDKKEEQLFCARDRVGIKPFFYVFDNNKFLFASDIKTLIASGLYDPKVNIDNLYSCFAFGLTPRPNTAFEGVSALEAGTWLKINSDGTSINSRYWSIPVGSQKKSMSENEALELIESSVMKAVNYRVQADVGVGVFMSGGVDSTLVAALASRRTNDVQAFTLGFNKSSCLEDEVYEASMSAKKIGISHRVKLVDPDEYLSNIFKISLGYEEPYYSVSPNYMVSSFVKESGVKVALNGLGGDELFCGYDYYKWCSLWDRTSLVRPLLRNFKGLNNISIFNKLSRFSINDPSEFHSNLFARMSESDLQTLFSTQKINVQSASSVVKNLYGKRISFEDSAEAFSYMDLRNYVGNHHVERLDQFTMANSIEGRFPFLDHNVIETAFSIPSKLKLYNNERKYLLRKVAKKYIASEALAMKKKGFSLPLESWMKSSLSSFVVSNLNELKDRDVFDPDVINEWYGEYLNGKRVYTDIWNLVSTNIWFKQFFDERNFEV